jgi:hypothetical protein
VNGKAQEKRRSPVPQRGGGKFPLKGKFFPVPGAYRGGYAKAAADIFGVRFTFKQILQMDMGITGHNDPSGF